MSILASGVLLLSTAAAVAPAPHSPSLICQLVLEEERNERDDLDLSLRLARTQMQAAERIHALLDDLWKKKAVERLVFLRAQHDREVTVIEHDRARSLLQRQESVLEQYRLVCGASTGKETSGNDVGRAVAEAMRRYRRAHCDVLAADERRAGADLAFFEELLLSARDLRVSSVGTEQSVIIAERDVEMARTRLEQNRLRAERCLAEPGNAPP